jgi:hypothetical protein
MMFSRDFSKKLNNVLVTIADHLHKAVPAVSPKQMMPRWRNLGRSVTPYHFMKPVPVPVQQPRNRA